jgi:hypothetical protein
MVLLLAFFILIFPVIVILLDPVPNGIMQKGSAAATEEHYKEKETESSGPLSLNCYFRISS